MVEENIQVNFKANASQLNRIMQQLKALQTKVKTMSKDMTRFNNSLKGVSNRFKTATGRTTALNKKLKDQEKVMKNVRASMDKLKKGTDKYNKSTKDSDRESKKASGGISLMGFRLLAVGGMANFAAQQLKDAFITTLTEMGTVLSEINRVNLFSDTAFKDGEVGLDGFNNKIELSKKVAQEYGLLLEEVPTLLKEIEKASPSSLNIDMFRDAVVGFKVLENEVSTSKLAGDFSTILANFPELDMSRIEDLTFAFSRESKLSFGAGSKAIAFAAQSAKVLNTDLDELLGIMVSIVAAVPGDRGTAGRSVRAFINGMFSKESLETMHAFNVEFADANNEFIGLEKILENINARYDSIKEAQGGVAAGIFLSELGLSANAFTGVTAFLDKTEEVKRQAKEAFDDNIIGGTKAKAVEDQLKKPEAVLNRLKNIITSFKLDFSLGVFEELAAVSDILKDVFADGELAKVAKEFGQAIGETLVNGLKAVLPVLKSFADMLKDNPGLVKALAVGTVVLAGALTVLGSAFLIAGSGVMLVSIYSRISENSKMLAASTNLLGKAYSRLLLSMNKAGRGIANIFRALGSNMFHGLKLVITRLPTMFLAAGARAGAFFGSAFNILANAFIGAGAWVKALFARFAVASGIGGIASGVAFGRAFGLAAAAGVAAAPILVAVGGLFVGFELGKILDDNIRKPLQFFFQDLEVDAALQGVNPLQLLADNMLKSLTGTTFTEIGTQLKERFDGFLASLSDINAFDAGKMIMTKVFGGLFGGIFLLKDELFKQMQRLWAGEYSDVGSDIGNEVIDGIINTFTGLATLLKDAILGEASKWMDIGKSIGEFMADGFKSIFNIDLTGGVFDPRNHIPATDKQSGGFFEANPQFKNGYPGSKSNSDPNPAFQEYADYLEAEKSKGNPLGIKTETQEEINTNAQGYLAEIIKTSDSFDVLAGTNNSISDVTSTGASLTEKNNSILEILSGTFNVQINEIIKNINLTSRLSTIITEVQLMFAHLIAQGNRAAGKLSSLRVSKKGKFSISDPGVSSFDQGRINTLTSLVGDTKANETNITPQVFVEINPTITLADGSSSELQGAADTLTKQISDTLQQQISSISN